MSSIVDLLDGNAGLGDSMNRHIGGLVRGTVVDNNDPDKHGRVKVEYTTWEGELKDWLPVLTPYGGKEYGAYLIPEVGDIVIIGFIGNDLHVPFVMGSLFPSDESFCGDAHDPKNLVRRLKTKGGIQMTLSDESGKEGIQVATPGELTLQMEDEGNTALLSDKNGDNKLLIDAQNGEITIEAKTKITLKAGSCEIVMDGSSGKLSISCGTLEISADQKTSIAGGPQVEISGQQVKVSGTQMTVEGSAQTAVKGGILQLN